MEEAIIGTVCGAGAALTVLCVYRLGRIIWPHPPPIHGSECRCYDCAPRHLPSARLRKRTRLRRRP